MSNLIRFGVSLEKDLLTQFDRRRKEKKYTNRSEAIRDLIREDLTKKVWQENKVVAGIIALVYNHHRWGMADRLTDIQHDYHHSILSTQHIHLDQDNCLEIIVTRGRARQIQDLYGRLKSTKGVKHSDFAIATTEREA